jgi:hypothetical protein
LRREKRQHQHVQEDDRETSTRLESQVGVNGKLTNAIASEREMEIRRRERVQHHHQHVHHHHTRNSIGTVRSSSGQHGEEVSLETAGWDGDHDVLEESIQLEQTLLVAKDLFAGTCGGILQVVSGHPLDTIKVRL